MMQEVRSKDYEDSCRALWTISDSAGNETKDNHTQAVALSTTGCACQSNYHGVVHLFVEAHHQSRVVAQLPNSGAARDRVRH